MVVNKKASKIQKFFEVLFVGVVFVEVVLLTTVFIGTVLVAFIISSQVITELSIILPVYLQFSRVHVA